MLNNYPIAEVKPEWVIEPETMGSKEKFWYRHPKADSNWLFKYPKANTGEHWAEKIAAQIASVLEIEHPEVKLAHFQGKYGSVTESFVHGGGALYHGNQMLRLAVDGYSPDEKFRHSSHTLSTIWEALDRIFPIDKDAQHAKLSMAEYAVLDAFIGNTDRHHENWGILWKRTDDHWIGRISPSFDHASSLGRELEDSRRDRLLAENRVGRYAEKGRGGIYWSEDDRRGPSPLELVRRATRLYPDLFRPALRKLGKLNEDITRDIVDRVPADWMSPSARMFTIALMHYNLEQLREIA